jgi:NAD+ diphosphatase
VNFEPGVEPPAGNRKDPLMFIFRENEMLVIEGNRGMSIPRAGALPDSGVRVRDPIFLGMLDGTPCYCGEMEKNGLKEGTVSEGISSLQGVKFSVLRPLLGSFDDELFRIAGIAFQVINWYRTHRYCGRCGSLMETRRVERAMLCPECGFSSFPRISPAIIVAVVRGDKILLARANRFPPDLYSVLAGFVEPGETLEECLRREVREEVGVGVKDVRYYGSQPWPFPHSLMIAFTAKHAKGELKIDPEEIADAGWFGKDELPRIPPVGTIARELIDWFVREQGLTRSNR